MKIGLIAMSGIRACDAELLRLGLTLPGFVERSKTIASLPSLGLLTLAGMTPRGSTRSATSRSPDIRSSTRTLPSGFDLVAHLELHRADRRGLRAGRPLPRAGHAGRAGRPARDRAAGGGARTLRRRRASAKASCSGASCCWTPRPGGCSPLYRARPGGLRPGRCPPARLRAAGHRALQPADGADQPRLSRTAASSAPARSLLSERYRQKPVGEGAARDRPHPRDLAAPVHRVRRRQQLRQQRLLAGAAAEARACASCGGSPRPTSRSPRTRTCWT